MALSATIYNFTVALSDSDRGVYESLELKAARHPSETAEHLRNQVEQQLRRLESLASELEPPTPPPAEAPSDDAQ